ncbi:MlaD family protein [Conexibacter sp. SYSU D00693]|uniref:MlaD family protein n=1 Tax=Conexibacter sp. SYSU D00693 TaxID=2812560 RepID=UPI00196B07F0|nr:MlaD family protein [Conexibacter sp. SYSU D00693]
MTTLRRLLPIIAIAIPGLFTVGFWFVHSGTVSTGGDPYRVKAVLPSSSTLGKGAGVTIAGLRVGRVADVDRAPDGVGVTLELDPDHAPVTTDTRFGLRLRTLVGENYVELFPGRGAPLPDGGVLPKAQAQRYVDVDEILESLRGPTRDRARAMLRGLGEGLDGEGRRLNRTVGGVSGFVAEATPIVGILHGKRRQLSRLVDELGQVTAAVGQRGDAVRELSTMARRTFRAVAARDQQLKATIDRLPALVRQARSTAGVVELVGRQAAPVLSTAATAVREVRPTVRRLPAVAAEGARLVDELDRTAPRLRPTLRDVRSLAAPTLKALPQVRAALCEINPAISYLVKYQRDLVGLLQGMGSTTNYYDANGHAARLSVNLGEQQLRIFDERSSKLLNTLLRNKVVSRVYNVGYNPLPDRSDEVADGSHPSGPKHVTKPYPRIHAEC